MLEVNLAEKHRVPTLPREIAPGTFWFGCCLEVPQGDKIFHNHNSCYLVTGDKATVLVDTGMPYGWSQLRDELRSVLAGRPLDYIFPTHPEAPHMGNTGALIAEFPDVEIVGDLRNYHLYYPEAQHKFRPMKAGQALDLGGRTLMLVPAVVHDLPNTLWGYVPEERILFVCDAYPYTHEHEAHQCGMTSEELPFEVLPQDTTVVIRNALNWVRYVDADRVMPALLALLERYPVDIIGPTHGGVITNPKDITRVFELGLRSVRVA